MDLLLYAILNKKIKQSGSGGGSAVSVQIARLTMTEI